MSHKRQPSEAADRDMLPEYDFSGQKGIRGKYYRQLRAGYTLKIEREDGTSLVQQITAPEGTVVLDPDVREYFAVAEAVNRTLRGLIHLIPHKKTKGTHPTALT